MSFIQSALTSWWIVVPLLSAPIIIHLINLLRHKKVQWGAMEFLLASQKRNRNYIRFKQILLLLMRIAALAVILLLLAGLVLPDQWSKMFGGSKVHHIVLLDDSYSTQDQHDDGTVFDRGVEVVRNIVGHAAEQKTEQRFSLVRYSQAAQHQTDLENNKLSSPDSDEGSEETPVDATAPAENGATDDTAEIVTSSTAGGVFRRQLVSDDLEVRLDNATKNIEATSLPLNPEDALSAIGTDVSIEEDEKLIVYVVSDFRNSDWTNADAYVQELERIRELGAEIHFISTVDSRQANLAITDLRPVPGVHASGVSLDMEVEVTNFSSEPVRKVSVQIESQANSDDGQSEPQVYALPSVPFDSIAPGQSIRKQFRATFQTAGDHQVTARLEADALEIDNERFSIVRVLPEAPVLIVDGLVDSYAGKLLKLALSPSRKVRTGLDPRIVPSSFLKENPLKGFQSIFMLNVISLDDDELRALKSYVAEGGGLIFFTDDETSPQFVNEKLYNEGRGLFPAPLKAPVYLEPQRGDAQSPDVQVELTHPVFERTFGSGRNSFLNLVLLDRYYTIPSDWNADNDDRVKVIATVRNGDPLMIERSYGEGRVITMLTTAAPDWNNWGRGNPTFQITMLELQTYLSEGKAFDGQRQVGSPMTLDFAREMYDPRVELNAPGRGIVRRELEQKAINSEDRPELSELEFDGTNRPGVYEAVLTRVDGKQDARRFAFNVAGGEGDLEVASPSDLANAVEGIDYEYHRSVEFVGPSEDQAGFNLSEDWRFFMLLILLLIGEQLLAYSASFHPPLKGGSR